ncbi:unnamed protein product, partial [marine sediment metagenome]
MPIYRQLEDILEEEIAAKQLAPGTRLPSERELCELYGVSVTPVRRALQDLVDRGLVRRRRGSGTFVADAPAAGGPVTIVFHKWIEL